MMDLGFYTLWITQSFTSSMIGEAPSGPHVGVHHVNSGTRYVGEDDPKDPHDGHDKT